MRDSIFLPVAICIVISDDFKALQIESGREWPQADKVEDQDMGQSITYYGQRIDVNNP